MPAIRICIASVARRIFARLCAGAVLAACVVFCGRAQAVSRSSRSAGPDESSRQPQGSEARGDRPARTLPAHAAGRREEFAPMSPSITRAVAAHMLHAERGQGTVEYVGIVLAVAALLVAVAAAIDNKVGGPIATALVHRLQEAVTQVGNAKHG